MEYQFTIASAFPNAKVSLEKLQAEITAFGGTLQSILSCSAADGVCTAAFASPLNEQGIADLNAVVAAHDGIDVALEYKTHGTMSTNEIVINAVDPSWNVIGGAYTSASYFVPNIAQAVGVVQFQYKTSDDGCVVQIVEDDNTVLGTMNLPNSNGQWAAGVMQNTVPPQTGNHSYSVRARKTTLDGEIRFMSFVLYRATDKATT